MGSAAGKSVRCHHERTVSHSDAAKTATKPAATAAASMASGRSWSRVGKTIVNPSRVVKDAGAALAALSAWRRFAASHRNAMTKTPAPTNDLAVSVVTKTDW